MMGIDETFFSVRRMPWWQVALIASVGLAIVVALVVVTAGLILLLAPVIFLATLIRRLMTSSSIRASDARTDRRPQVIEAEYEVVDAPPDRGNRGNHQ